MPADLPDFTTGVNITGSSVTLNVSITASSVTLNVNIASSAATLNVNLAASAITVNINFTGQTTYVANGSEYYPLIGNGLFFNASGAMLNNTSTQIFSFTPQPLHNVWVSGFYYGHAAAVQVFSVIFTLVANGVTIAQCATTGGDSLSFLAPIPFGVNTLFQMFIGWQGTAGTQNMFAGFYGWHN